MLRATGTNVGRAMVIAIMALSISVLAATAGAMPSAPESSPGRPVEVDYESGAKVKVEGLELDRRFGRAWLLATLTGEGHLRTVSSYVKAFAPSGELEAGLVRIPLIPKLPVAKELRRVGRTKITFGIYFRPTGRSQTEYLRRRAILVRNVPVESVGSPH